MVCETFRNARPSLAGIGVGKPVISELIDALGLFMMEIYQRAREEVIIRQQTEISELRRRS